MPEIPPITESPYEISRLLQNLVRWGTVVEVRRRPLAVRMKCGENTTDWLPPMCIAAGNEMATFRLPEVGEQGVALCPAGDLGQGAVLLGWYQDKWKQASEDKPRIRFNKGDNDYIEYDKGELRCQMGKSHLIVNSSFIQLDCENASLRVGPDTITAEPDIVIGGISFMRHLHGGVIRGGSNTDGPQ